MNLQHLLKKDLVLHGYLQEELLRQQETLELIASENIVSQSILEAQGSIATNKYAEGYPSSRYYGGCEAIDKIENLAIDRLKQIFQVDHANVQPHSGSQANQAVFLALLKPSDHVLAMNLNEGGHLTHGHPVNASGLLYNFQHYKLNDTCEIDYDNVRDVAKQHRPKLIIAGGSAYAKKIDFKKFREIADEVGAYLMVDMAHYAGLIASELYPSPVPYAHVITSTTHKTLRGPRGGIILCIKELAQKIDKAIFPGLQGGPLMHVIAAKATAFGEVLKPEFKEYSKQVILNAQKMAKEFTKKEYSIVGGGTDCHFFLMDLTAKKMTGLEAQTLLDQLNITINKNSIPKETLSPTITSGIRIGTPAVTTRGMKENEMEWIAEKINLAFQNKNNSSFIQKLKSEVQEFCLQFPIYKD